MTKQPLTPAEFVAARNAAGDLLRAVGPTAAQLADFAAFNRGDAITQSLATLYEAEGFDHGKRVLTEAEWVTVAAYGWLVPSTPANNVWD
jgi:hypothetical protein